MAQPTNYKNYISKLNQLLLNNDELKNSRVVIFYGLSNYLIQKSSSALIERWVKVLNCSPEEIISLEAQDLNNHMIHEIWDQSSCFSSESIYSIKRGEKRKDWKLIQSFLHLSPVNRVCITLEQSKIPNQLQQLSENNFAFTILCEEPAPWELPHFVLALSKKYQLKVSSDTVAKILDCVGHDLCKIENEIIKLSTIFYQHKKELTWDELAPFLGYIRDEHAFVLDQYLRDGHWSHAYLLMMDLMEKGESPQAILGVLARHLRNSISILDLKQKEKLDDYAVAKKLHLPVKVVSSYAAYVTKYSMRDFVGGLKKCFVADYTMKSRSLDQTVILSDVMDSLIRLNRVS